MMKQISGLIIKEVNVGEENKIITIISPQFGKIQAVANGVRNYKSKLFAGCSIFCYSNFVIKEGKEIHRIVSAEPIETFYNIRCDIENLSLATYFCELLCETSTDANGIDKILQLMLNSLYILSKNQGVMRLKPIFELRLMAELGFAPILNYCGECGKTALLNSFSVNNGTIYCNECNYNSMQILDGTINAMKYIVSCDIKKIFSFKVDDCVQKQLDLICENYTVAQIGRQPRSLKYLKSI